MTFILVAAARGEACSQRFLTDRLGVDRTMMTYLLDDLEEAGTGERGRTDSVRQEDHGVSRYGKARCASAHPRRESGGLGCLHERGTAGDCQPMTATTALAIPGDRPLSHHDTDGYTPWCRTK